MATDSQGGYIRRRKETVSARRLLLLLPLELCPRQMLCVHGNSTGPTMPFAA